MKKLFLLTLASVSIMAWGYSFDENEYEPVKKLSDEEIKKLTPEQLEEYRAGRRLYTLHKNGGIIWLEGKGKMLVSVVNDAVEMAAIAGCVGQVKDSLRIKVEVKPLAIQDVVINGFAEEMTKADAQIGVFVVDAPNLPQSLYALEEGWAMVNVAQLKADNPPINKRLVREKKAVARGFMMALGCATDQDNTSPMKPVKSLTDLDKVSISHISFWNLGEVNDYLKGMGIVPDTMTTYKRAAIAGMAPPPTNQWQQAIWEKVKAEQSESPSNPIRIKPGDKPKGK